MDDESCESMEPCLFTCSPEAEKHGLFWHVVSL